MNLTNNSLQLNMPMTNVFQPTESILPERFNSISTPSGFSLVGKELSSISEPDDDDKDKPEEKEEKKDNAATSGKKG